jgi:hypothetical protein
LLGSEPEPRSADAESQTSLTVYHRSVLSRRLWNRTQRLCADPVSKASSSLTYPSHANLYLPSSSDFPRFRYSLMTQASYSLADGPAGAGQCKGDSAHCFLPFGSGERSVSSIFLLANGISFAIMTLGFTTFGGLQDYKTYNRWFLMGLTVVCWASCLGFLGVKDGSDWRAAMALYMVSLAGVLPVVVSHRADLPVEYTDRLYHLRSYLGLLCVCLPSPPDATKRYYRIADLLASSSMSTAPSSHVLRERFPPSVRTETS